MIVDYKRYSRGRLTLIDLEIDRLRGLLKESNIKLERGYSMEEVTKNNNLHSQLRKLTNEANKDTNIFYCSQCGDRFKRWRDRVEHVKVNHEEMG